MLDSRIENRDIKIHFKRYGVSWSIAKVLCGVNISFDRHLRAATRNPKLVTCEKCKAVRK